MRKTDINKYNTASNETGTKGETGRIASTVSRSVWQMVCKFIKTFFVILVIAGTIVLGTVVSFIISMRNEAVIELSNTNISLKYTSFIYALDENGNDTEYMSFYSYENRVWVDYKDIPQQMIDAITAIEDKRFAEHHGVDWKRTAGAILGLITGKGGGGSTITQQLIKNVTGDDDVSLTRKIKEIFSALNLEKKYSCLLYTSPSPRD